jgi:Na+-transporting NADH:ubiquinone oxidoreductase subunit A
VIEEDKHRELLGWQMPGFDKHSVTRLFLSFALPFKKFDMTSNTHGSPRAFVPVGNFEKVMPLDMMASPLVKSLLSNDVEMAIQLGVLELDEEDLGLFNYVCPGKTDYGPLLRDMLTYIEKEG